MRKLRRSGSIVRCDHTGPSLSTRAPRLTCNCHRPARCGFAKLPAAIRATHGGHRVIIVADALAEADSEQPDLLVDLATLTGAARVALGPELPAAYSPNDALLDALRKQAAEECDPVWPMPLWPGYDEELASKVADLGNVAATPFAGSIIAALFLKRFVTQTPNWLHVDLYAWNGKERPGRPVGAEAQCVRGLFQLIRSRFRC